MLDAPPGLPSTEWRNAAEHAQRFQGRVLLAEDDPDSREVVHAMLQSAGLAVDEVDNGQMAFRRILSAAAETPYDLILMDMQMPGIDGYQATRRLRSIGWRGIIIALTAHAMSGDRDKCLEAGCNDYLCKPITGNSLTALLARHLQPQLDLPDTPSHPGETMLRQQGALDDPNISEDQRRTMLATFVQRLSERLGELDRALHDENRTLLEQAAHRLMGAAGLFGFHEISNSARTLEERARRQKGFDVLATDVRELTDLCQRVANARQAGSP
jgi:CheY-like chemotaxis protein/HPt (histidine-containing phosphotransfer) domain-containing protein